MDHIQSLSTLYLMIGLGTSSLELTERYALRQEVLNHIHKIHTHNSDMTNKM